MRSSLARLASGCRSPTGGRGVGSTNSGLSFDVADSASVDGGESVASADAQSVSGGFRAEAAGHDGSADTTDLEAAAHGHIPLNTEGLLIAAANTPPSPSHDSESFADHHRLSRRAGKWRVASRTVTMFSRRAAAGLMHSEEPLDHEEEAAIAELTQHSGEHHPR